MIYVHIQNSGASLTDDVLIHPSYLFSEMNFFLSLPYPVEKRVWLSVSSRHSPHIGSFTVNFNIMFLMSTFSVSVW